MFTKLMTIAAGAAAAGAGVVATAPHAGAATARNGVCETGEFCYSYNSGFAGSVSDFTASLGDYGTRTPSCYVFVGAGKGKGQCIKNNAASAWNRTSKPVHVYYNTGFGGASQKVAAGARVDLTGTLKNNNASHRIGTPPASTKLSYGLYRASGGYISCAFDGYRTTPGRHEGIDIRRAYGSPVRALVTGTVISKVNGANGGGGLSTIAVYNASLDKTVVYLHSAPLSGLRVGQSVSVGQQIATEAYRGISSSSGYHTHVEMRPGKQYYAAKSVNDWTLSNPDPTSFWNARGYIEQ